jgi:hypothetical protein
MVKCCACLEDGRTCWVCKRCKVAACLGCSDEYWYLQEGRDPMHRCMGCKEVVYVDDAGMNSKKLLTAALLHADDSRKHAAARRLARCELRNAEAAKSASVSRVSSLRRAAESDVAASLLEHCGLCGDRLVVPASSSDVYVSERCLGCKAWRCSVCHSSAPGRGTREPTSCSREGCSASGVTGEGSDIDRCPACAAVYFRGEGCSQVTCGECGNSWVWGQGDGKSLGMHLPGHSSPEQIAVTERLVQSAKDSHAHYSVFNMHMGAISAVDFDLNHIRDLRSKAVRKLDARVLRRKEDACTEPFSAREGTALADAFAEVVYLSRLESICMEALASAYGIIRSMDAAIAVYMVMSVVNATNDSVRALSHVLGRQRFHFMSPFDLRVTCYPASGSRALFV